MARVQSLAWELVHAVCTTKKPPPKTNKQKKPLGINFTKDVVELYTENYKKTLMKEIEDDSEKWKDIP